ncbi:MAG: DUF4159 domain-containing protein [Candidatus Latescibacteria bacterium]|nr:DUF4159 domain-containing protein [Candidatus Latescibacterota bacterium]
MQSAKCKAGVIFCILYFAFCIFPASTARSEVKGPGTQFTIARLKYSGGGDWYDGPSGTVNLLRFLRQHTRIDAAAQEVKVGIADEDFFAYPFYYMTGHGNVRFSEEEAVRLRTYLENGGFLFANDDYGMDLSFRREMKRVFPDKELVEIPPSHGIFHDLFDFPDGLPKVHEHDGGPPHAYGIFCGKRLVVFYNFNTDIADGWDDPEVHHDPPEKREAALRMGANVVVWALTN